jgi:hypothetical protein
MAMTAATMASIFSVDRSIWAPEPTEAGFGQYASFTGGVVFGAQASFEFAAFDSAARFDAVDFDAGVSFRGATFGGG